MDGSNEQFCKYFANTLKPKLTLNFKNLGDSANTWTNNNAESVHNMKIDTNWRPPSTLIDVLHGMMKLQLLDLQCALCALYNIGNFRLFGVNRKYCIREDICRSKSDEDQKKYSLNFLKSSTVKPQYVVSKGGETKVPMKAKACRKKKNQHKERDLLTQRQSTSNNHAV